MIRFFHDGLIWYQHEHLPVTRPHGNIIVYTSVVICRITDLGGEGVQEYGITQLGLEGCL